MSTQYQIHFNDQYFPDLNNISYQQFIQTIFRERHCLFLQPLSLSAVDQYKETQKYIKKGYAGNEKQQKSYNQLKNQNHHQLSLFMRSLQNPFKAKQFYDKQRKQSYFIVILNPLAIQYITSKGRKPIYYLCKKGFKMKKNLFEYNEYSPDSYGCLKSRTCIKLIHFIKIEMFIIYQGVSFRQFGIIEKIKQFFKFVQK